MATIAALGGALLAAFHINSIAHGAPKGHNLIWFTLALNFTSSLVIFLIAALLISSDNKQDHIDLLKENLLTPLQNSIINIEKTGNKSVINQIPWSSFIENSSEIYFIVQGWDKWFQDYGDELKKFFVDGGIFRLFVCDPNERSAMSARSLMASRLGKTPRDVVSEITETVDEIENLYKAADCKGSLEIIYMKKLNWYFSAKFIGKNTDSLSKLRDIMVFSIYSHTRHPVKDMPVMILYPDIYPQVNIWFESEIRHLKNS